MLKAIAAVFLTLCECPSQLNLVKALAKPVDKSGHQFVILINETRALNSQSQLP